MEKPLRRIDEPMGTSDPEREDDYGMLNKSGLALHLHHDILWEYCFDYNERVSSIMSDKPAAEQELRLRLFQIVDTSLLPGQNSSEWAVFKKVASAYKKARAAYKNTFAAYDKTLAAYEKARAAYNKALAAYKKAFAGELEALHRRLCPDCPFDGQTIFTSGG